MKIRIQGDRVRLRLSQGEVQQIGELTPVVQQTHFGDSTLTYSIYPSDNQRDTSASFSNNEIRIDIPSQVAKQWADTDQVGFETEPGKIPFVLVEKDFKCLAIREGEDESDLFHNPNTTC